MAMCGSRLRKEQRESFTGASQSDCVLASTLTPKRLRLSGSVGERLQVPKALADRRLGACPPERLLTHDVSPALNLPYTAPGVMTACEVIPNVH
jgi:hypothetical protein